MTTLNQLIDEVQLRLAGFTMRQDRLTHIASAITATATTITVASAANISKGIIEIDDELILVDAFNPTNGTLNIAPYGRGYLGTSAVPHSANAKVVIAPTFPRISIKTAINNTILGTGLYGVKSSTFTSIPTVSTYSLPSSVKDVLSVSVQDKTNISKEWFPIRRWRVDKTADASAFGSSKSISIYDVPLAGSTFRVVYTLDPDVLDLGSDDLEDMTGFEPSMKDVIVLGAAYDLISFLEPGRFNVGSAEADSNKIQFGSGTNLAKYIYALYQQRLAVEQKRLQEIYPVRTHYTR